MTVDAFPSQYAVDVGLRDGSVVHVRPVRQQDQSDLVAFYSALSDRSRWFRFFSAGVNLERQARRAVDVDYHDTFGLVALTEDAVVGHAQYLRIDADRAEIAFAVADAMQGRGLATVLLAHLAERAHEEGITTLHADVLRDNRRMLDVFRESGFPSSTRVSDEALVVELPASLSPATLQRFDERERAAVVAAVARFLRPRSVAVIGASRRRGTVGGELLHNLVAGGFTGIVHPVNPAADTVQDLTAYPDIGSVPAPVDLALIAVPADAVVDVARACVRAKVPARDRDLRRLRGDRAPPAHASRPSSSHVCRHGGCAWSARTASALLNTDPNVHLNATFAPVAPPAGQRRLPLAERRAGDRGHGAGPRARHRPVVDFVSVGNKADVSGNDLLQYWEQDPTDRRGPPLPRVVRQPARASAASPARVGRRKPIVAVKSGRSRAGARGDRLAHRRPRGRIGRHRGRAVRRRRRHPHRHAGRAVRRRAAAGPPAAAARRTAWASSPTPAARRSCAPTPARPPGSKCGRWRMRPSARLGRIPARGGIDRANPVDMIASATAEHYGTRPRPRIADPARSTRVIAIFIPPLCTRPAEVGAAIAARRGGSRAPSSRSWPSS